MVDHTASNTPAPANFIRQIIDEDLRKRTSNGRVVTRFPPEPNGYPHIGHAKSICLNFGIARDYGGRCYLRFDDTNPSKEDIEYVNAMKAAVRWLGFDWEERLTHSSDYFERLYEFAVELIRKGKAYVCSLNSEQIREYRGTLKTPGRDSPYRNRSVEENLNLFQQMRAGEFANGEHVLRAKIDMTSPRIIMRDPILYRILHTPHHMTGDKWCIYPMYDLTHCLSDALEDITHSICTLEFEDNRALYDWVLDNVTLPFSPHRPKQIEFARLSLDYTVMSKRKLSLLVNEGHVSGWDDPRMPTIAGLRRRGYTSAAVRNFCERIGVTKTNAQIDMGVLENCIREDLDHNASRVMCVLRPLKVIITNYPEDKHETINAQNHPQRPELGSRKVPFGREIYIEQDDFAEIPPKGFKRLISDGEVRLRYAYIIKCEEIIRDPQTGKITELHCTYDPDSYSGGPNSKRKVKGIIHWVSALDALQAEVRLYDRLFNDPQPDTKGDFVQCLNPASIEVLPDARLEPGLAQATTEERYQFERQGYFCLDKNSTAKHRVFNRTVSLRDVWAKRQN